MAWNIAALAALLLALGYIGFLHYRVYVRERALARTDDLTRIDNRRAFYENASREFERARRYNHPFTLAYFDADDFRELNVRFGQQVADGVLRLIAETAREAIRASDLVARLGADQFALLLPEAGADAASAVIRKLQQALR
ncbi:MAG: GGDEF domain-containing protein, partial [Gemmatimonadetes bacterium]